MRVLRDSSEWLTGLLAPVASATLGDESRRGPTHPCRCQRSKSRRRAKGAAVKLEHSNPLKGVSGVFTLISTLAAITRAKGSGGLQQIC